MFRNHHFWPCHAACMILVPWLGTEPGPTAVKSWSPNHRTAREFPGMSFFKKFYFFFGCAVSSLMCKLFSSCGVQSFHCDGFSYCGGFSSVELRLWGVWAYVVARGLSSCSSWALEHRLSSCGKWTYLFLDIWDLSESGMSPALVGRFFTTEPPGKPQESAL